MPHATTIRRCTAAALAALALSGCGAPAHRFPLRAPLWVDDDRRPFSPQPSEQYNSWIWDAVDNTVFRPLAEVWEYEESREAIDVNALDEVPSSSWFENRIGQRPLSIEELTTGACAGSRLPAPPWTVVEAKTQGETPGFVIEAEGNRYLFKTDIRVPELTTAADAIATRIFHASGYSTPCNHVVFFTPDFFVLAPAPARADSEADEEEEEEDDDDEVPTQADVDEVLAYALPTGDGRFRGSLSRFIEGPSLGGWRFDGRRGDDPNDVVPHEHRREVRGMYVLSAWLNHIDSRAENNYDEWVVTDGERGYVRHHVLDMGDSFGLIWDHSDALTRRFGHSHYFDLEHIAVDLVTLGIPDRPWHEHREEPVHPVFTYYGVADFVPDQWRNGYPNPGFERRTERDTAWMARIVSQFTEENLRTLVRTGVFSDPRVEADLVRILRGRQRAILERYLTRLSPLAFPEIVPQGERAWLCLRDLAVESGIRAQRDRRYQIAAAIDWPEPRDPLPLEPGSAHGRVCTVLPDLVGPGEDGPRYLVVDVVASSEGAETTGAASVHLYQTGPRRYEIVGLRRLDPP